jgi:hypothetical protein
MSWNELAPRAVADRPAEAEAAMTDAATAAREHYARRLAEIDRWLSRRPWTATDWELLGARVILQRAISAESSPPTREVKR